MSVLFSAVCIIADVSVFRTTTTILCCYRLKCWYSSENDPFLKYAPFKVEQMYITPDIFIFHDVLSDNEIDLIKGMAKPKVSFDDDVGYPSHLLVSYSGACNNIILVYCFKMT